MDQKIVRNLVRKEMMVVIWLAEEEICGEQVLKMRD